MYLSFLGGPGVTALQLYLEHVIMRVKIRIPPIIYSTWVLLKDLLFNANPLLNHVPLILLFCRYSVRNQTQHNSIKRKEKEYNAISSVTGLQALRGFANSNPSH